MTLGIDLGSILKPYWRYFNVVHHLFGNKLSDTIFLDVEPAWFPKNVIEEDICSKLFDYVHNLFQTSIFDLFG